MSEERMERKCVARSQQPKAGPADCKKTDGGHKPWPRSGKKREGGNSGSRNEPPRRNLPPQRGTAARPRSQLPSRGSLGGEESSGLEEVTAELGSVFTPGSKKQSLNHLLKFVYAPRETAHRPAAPPRPRRTSTLHPHHTELFLQASCQFVVREGGDYAAHLRDPDLPVSWEHVLHVVVRGTASECPVCLAAPVGARVTRCGHVYCWACALHYAAVHPCPAPPCPVCAAPLHVAHLKSASLRNSHTALEGEEMEMRLVRRSRHSTLVEPVPETGAAAGVEAGAGADTFPQWDGRTDLPYANIVTINHTQMFDIIQRERAEISQQILDEIDTSELPYLEQALDLLQQQEAELTAVQPPASCAPSPPRALSPPLQRQAASVEAPHLDWFDVTDDEPARAADARPGDEDSEDDAEERTPSLNPDAPEFVAQTDSEDSSPQLSDADKENQAKYFYFYQEASGAQTFLHGLNVRLLQASWGGLAAAPRSLRARLLSYRQFTVTKQSRLHAPCTAHLPLYCPYELVELELHPPHVTRRALALYAEELEKRARQRSRAQREERRRERRAAPPPPPPHTLHHYPPPRPDLPVHTDPTPPAHTDPTPPAHTDPAPSAHTDPHAPLSFAKMASARGAWHVRPPRAASPPPPPRLAPAAPVSDEDAPSPPRTLSLSDAIEAALLATPRTRTRSSKKKNKIKCVPDQHAC